MCESLHMESALTYANDAQYAGGNVNKNVPKAQDLHVMLDVILDSYVKLQDTGFTWNLMYQNTPYNGIEFVLFTPFFRVDSDEAEKLCGKFTSRTSNVACLCRYCECPTALSDRPYLEHPMKTKGRIKALTEANEVEELRQMSQHCIQNSMYKIRFGAHSEQGVHGACPMDMLHAINLGIFRYI